MSAPIKQRYWGVAAFALAYIALSAFARGAHSGVGGHTTFGGYVGTTMWAFVVWFAIRGNRNAILLEAKIAIFLQVSGVLFIYISNGNVRYLGYSAEEIAIGIALAAIPWIILHFWVKAKAPQELAPEPNPEASVLSLAPLDAGGSSHDRDRSRTDLTSSRIRGSSPQVASVSPVDVNSVSDQLAGGSGTIGAAQQGDRVASSPAKVLVDAKQEATISFETQYPQEVTFRKAKMVIEYSPAAAKAWSQMSGLPKDVQNEFLSALEANPQRDAEQLGMQLREEYTKKLRPYDDESANDALERARVLGKQAAAEFCEVYELLGANAEIPVILARLEAKFGVVTRSKLDEPQRANLPKSVVKTSQTVRLARWDKINELEAKLAAPQKND